MKSRSSRLPAEAAQAILDELQIRLIRPEERARHDPLIETQHHLKSADLAGEQLRYVAVDRHDRWFAMMSWSAPAYRLRARESWIGWGAWQREPERVFVITSYPDNELNAASFLTLKRDY